MKGSPADPSQTAGQLSGAFDVAVIGAGFGGLGAALSFAERGASVLLLEALNYPGGCASTFQRAGASYESGATLFSGLGPNELFGRWIKRYGLDVQVDWIDPLVEYRSANLELSIGRDRDQFVRALSELASAPTGGVERFFAHQRRVADALWGLIDEPRLLPPFGFSALASHLRHLPRTAPALRDIGKPLGRVLERFGVADFTPLRHLLDALCQITIQCGVAEAEAPVAMGAIDYFWRGTGHVRGGIGRLAGGLVDALRENDAVVHFSTRAKRLERVDSGWRVHTRRGTAQARQVVANLLPQDLQALLDPGGPSYERLPKLGRQLADGWGACMLYLQLEPNGEPPHHFQLVADPKEPLTEGNHVFCSTSGPLDGARAPEGRVTATVSTHVPMSRWRALGSEERGPWIAAIQERMRSTLRVRAPELDARIVDAFTGSPRTFERFTSRRDGLVGGVPRRADWRQYLSLRNARIAPGLHLVGDSVFPGQSTLATALGGWKLAEASAK